MPRQPYPALLSGEILWRIRKVFLEIFRPGWVQVSRVKWLRSIGVRIGEDCMIASDLYAREPYLVDIGNRVAIGTGVRFITPDGGAVAYVCSDRDCCGGTWPETVICTTSGLAVPPGPGMADSDPAWSSDGTAIALGRVDP